jgi:putative transposase
MKLNKRKIAFIVRKREYGMSTYQISREIKITERRVNQILELYRKTGKLPVLGNNIGRPKKVMYESEVNSILKCYEEFKLSASILRTIIKSKHGIDINHNRINSVPKKAGFVKVMEKKVRKKPWVRYEREHSLSAVHMDWLEDSERGKWICAVIDDASRMILSYGEFDHATGVNSVVLLKKALDYGKIREVITDRGTQFTSDIFREFCEKQNICRVKHPQSNGKIERWFGLYRQKRDMFHSLKEMVYWYNHIKPHLSLKFEELETPSQAFRRKFKK